MAHGASVPLRLSVPGADLGGVTDATTFLQGAKAALAVGGDPDGFCRLRELRGGASVPQAVVDGRAIGGYDERAALVRNGALPPRHAGGVRP